MSGLFSDEETSLGCFSFFSAQDAVEVCTERCTEQRTDDRLTERQA